MIKAPSCDDGSNLNISNDGNIRLKMKINVGIDANNGKIKENTLLAVVFNVISFPPIKILLSRNSIR